MGYFQRSKKLYYERCTVELRVVSKQGTRCQIPRGIILMSKKKKTEVKNKLKGTIVIDVLPLNDPDFRGNDNVPDTPMHDNFGGEPPKFDVNEPRMAVDYMKLEHHIPPKSKPVKSQLPLKELNKLVETIKTELTTEKTEVEVLEEGEIPQDSGTGLDVKMTFAD